MLRGGPQKTWASARLTEGPRAKAVRRPGVCDSLGVDPGALGIERREAHAVELPDLVGIARQDERDVLLSRAAKGLDGHVETRQRAVDLQRGSSGTGRREDGVEVELDGRAPPDHSRRQVADHSNGGVLHRGDDARGLSGSIELEVVMDRGEAPVEASAELGVVVELAVRADVQLDTVEQQQRIAELDLKRPEPRALLEQRLTPDAGHRALRVIGDGEDAMSTGLRAHHHLLERGLAISRQRGVNVEIADDRADRSRKAAVLRGLDLAGVFAQNGRDPRKTERRVDLLLGLACDDLATVDFG